MRLTISGAVETAVVLQVFVVLLVSNHLSLAPEIIDGSLLVGNDITSGNKDVVDVHALATVGHVQGVVGNSVCLVVGEAIEVPVCVGGQHDGSLLGGGQCDNLDVPVHSLEGVCHIGHNLAGETLLAIGVDDGEGDARVGVGHNSEVAVIPTVRATVKGIGAIGRLFGRVIVGLDVIILAVNLKGAVSDTVGVSSGDTTEMRVTLVDAVVGGVVEASNDVSGDTVLVIDQKVGDRGAVRDKGSLDTVSGEPVFTILIRTLALGRKDRREESGNDGSLEEHDCSGRVETDQQKTAEDSSSWELYRDWRCEQCGVNMSMSTARNPS